MFRNYIKIAFRNFRKFKVYSLINLSGLIIGLSVSILIIIYVKGEVSYDKFHENYENIYRMGLKQMRGDDAETMAPVSPAMGPDIKAEIPEFKDHVILKPIGKASLSIDKNEYTSQKMLLAGNSFFDIFSFPIIKKTTDDPLKNPNSLVLSETLAQRIFGEKEPLGQTLMYQNDKLLTVTAVVEDAPLNSHIQYDAILSFSTNSGQPDFYNKWDGNIGYYSYFLMQEGVKPTFDSRLSDLFYVKVNKKIEQAGWKVEPVFEPLENIYLKSDLLYDFSSEGNLNRVYIFSIIAFFILIIATINYMNLSTALSLQRIKEVGIRKVTGASKKRIITQFLGETIFLSMVALIISMILIEVLQPFFSQLIDKPLSIYSAHNSLILMGIPVLVILLGILAGSYPAFYVSSFEPVSILKNTLGNKKGGSKLQNILVLTQFVISIGLIISSIVIYSQISFLNNKEVGYNRENLVSISLYNSASVQKSELLRNRIVNHKNISRATVASAYPVYGLTQNGYRPEGMEDVLMFHALYVDPHYIPTLELKIKEGRNFRPSSPADEDKMLINETIARKLNWENPLGKNLHRNGVDYKVIGVVKNFHFESLHEPVGPVVFTLKPRKRCVLVRISEENFQETIQYLEEEWKEVTGNNVMSYQMIDDLYENLYKSETKFGETVLFFTILAIFLACLGLFGLTALSTTRRTKEIGIRKVLGANFMSLNIMLLRQYTRWVLIANIVAWPAAYFLMKEWLQNYAYKINLSISYFLAAGLITLIISLLTITYLAIRTSATNPVNSLRYE